MSRELVIAKKIYTLAKPEEFYTVMVIENGRIKELTDKDKIDLTSSNDQIIIDFSDYTIIPGFNDSHIHALGYGRNLENISLVGTNKEEFLRRIKEKASLMPTDQWLLGRGWDQENFVDSAYPSRFDLDKLSSDHPMLLHRICGHICVANSKALQLANITKDTPNPNGGLIDRDPNTNEPTGILREEAINLVQEIIPVSDDDQKMEWLRKASKELSKKGITSIQPNDGDVFNLYKSLKDNQELSVRVYLTPKITEIDDLKQKNIKSKIGDDFLRYGRIKIFSDGSLGAETAALTENYVNSSSNGILIHSEEKLLQLISKAHENGWQLETHAIGDRSAKAVIDSYEKTGSFKNRSVLTHCQILTEELVKKMADLGIIANIQPIFLNTDLHWAEKKIGSKRMKFSYAWKTLIDAGILCAGGSDSPVEKPDPLLGIHAAVNRQDNEGKPKDGWYPEEKLPVWEAVNLFTVNSAYAEFQEHQKGKLLPGYFADFVVLDRDIFLIHQTEIRTIQVVSTFMNGKQTYKQK